MHRQHLASGVRKLMSVVAEVRHAFAQLCLLAIVLFTAVPALVSQVLTPASLSFGNQLLGTTSVAFNISFKNNQTFPLNISSIFTSGDFAQTSNCPFSPSTLSAGVSCTISLTFTPTVVGTRTGTLIVNDNGATSQQTAALTGSGVLPVSLSPASVGFGSQVINTASAAATATLKNNQSAPLVITSIASSGDFTDTTNCPLSPNTLGANQSCTILVTFAPTAVGTRTGTLTVTDNAGSSPQIAQLNGSGVLAVALTPTSMSFGNQFVNTTSTVVNATLQNNQPTPLTISGISTVGDFSQTSNCPVPPSTLAAKGKCTISVTFRPTAAGSRSGTLTVSDNGANSPQTASLTGTGTAPVTLAPASLSFSNQIANTTSAASKVTLKNVQTVPLTISGISTTGDFAQTSNCPLSPGTLAAGTSCTISVTFTPSGLGSRNGTLIVSDSGSNSPQSDNLSGTGTLSGLTSIAISPANPTLSAGAQQQFVATGTFSGGVKANISAFVTWSSSAPSVLSVDSTGVAQANTQGTANVAASYGSITGTTGVTIAGPTVLSVTVTPANPSLAVGAYQQFTAILNYSDGSTKNATGQVTWSSSAPSVATISGSGFASAIAPGTTLISAAAGSVTGSTSVTVTNPQCATPPPGMIGWWTGDGNTVDIGGNNSGTLQNGAQYASGQVGQTFSFNGNGSSVLVNSPVYSTNAGTLQFWFFPTGAGSLIGSYDGANRTPGFAIDGSGHVTWQFGSLSNQALGQVSFNQWSHVALTYSTSSSQATVNVYLNGNLAANAIATPNTSEYSQLAIGAYLGAQISSFTGMMDEVTVFNRALSSQEIRTIYNAYSAGMCKPTLQGISLTPQNSNVAIGLTQQFGAVGSYSDSTSHDLTTSAAWASSNASVLTISGNGIANAIGLGNATITATLGSVSGSTGVNVIPSLVSIQVSPQSPVIAAGTTQSFTAIGSFSDGSTQDLTASVSWSSSQAAVATMTGPSANGIAAGQTTITATAGTISGTASLTVTPAALVSITISPANPTIASGTMQALQATGLFSDGSTQNLTAAVSWTSSSTSLATITGTGVAAGVSPGQATITASANSVSGSTTLTVTQAVLTTIAVTPANPSAGVGGSQQFTATGTFSDGSTQDLTNSATWTSSNTGVASIGSAGLSSAVGTGTATISASVQSVTGSTVLTVTLSQPTLVSITLNPGGQSIALGTTLQFSAIARFSDDSTQDVTTSASWGSTNPAVAAVNTAGLATSQSTGTVTITAGFGGLTGSTSLTVTSATITAINVSPASTSIPLGLTQQFTALGTFSDGSKQDITGSVHWSSSATPVATVSNSTGTSGAATGVGSGQTTISASSGSVSGSATLTVTGAVLAAINITPVNPSANVDGTIQLTANAIYTDGTSSDLTTAVTWASSPATVATISNASGSQGLITAVGSGSAAITATSGSILGSTTLVVQDPLVSISLSPVNTAISPGSSQQFGATGVYASGLTNDITNVVTWTSSSNAVATINSSGLSQGISGGQATITASEGSISSSTVLTVSNTPIPTDFRADISVGTTGQLFISWDTMSGATYYNLQRSTSPTSGYVKVAACSGTASLKNIRTTTAMLACRDGSLTPGTSYYYEIQACYSSGCSAYSTPISNIPVTSDCTPAQMPNVVGVTTLSPVTLQSSTVDPNIQFLPTAKQFAYYASSAVPRRNLLVVDLPGSDETCPGAGAFNNTAQKLGFDVLCVNYSNLSSQQSICLGDTACFGNISQAKLDATGVCSVPGQAHCGIDPKTGQPYYLSNPADAITQRISMMLQYLNANGYNQNGTNWGNYLSGTTPLWQNIILAGHSQGGNMSTFTAYRNTIARAVNISSPLQATHVNGIEVGADYLSNPMATNIRSIYGLVSTSDGYYQSGVFQATWQALGFTQANNDAEVKLNTVTPIGLTCNSGTPSHNFSTAAPPGPAGGHDSPLYLWNEDVYKFMLID